MKPQALRNKQGAGSTGLLFKRIKQRNGGIGLSISLPVLCALLFLLIACWGCATAQSVSKPSPEPAQVPPSLTDITFQDNAVTVTANKPFEYSVYKPGDPYKIIIDIPDVSISTFNKKIVSGKAGITEITPFQVQTPSFTARLEILLQSPSSFDQEYKNNVLTVRLKEDMPKKDSSLYREKTTDTVNSRSLLAKSEERITPSPSRQTPLARATEITSIGFDTYGDTVKLVIKGNGSITPNVFPLEDRIVIDVPDVAMNAEVPSEVVSPVTGIRSGTHDDAVRLVIDLREKTNFDVTAIADSIVITLKRPERESGPTVAARMADAQREEDKASAAVKGQEPEKNGNGRCHEYLEGKENVNFDFQNQDIVPILRLFADISGCNLFIHPDVRGTATMKFKDVPWNQALDTLLKTFSIGKVIEGNIIRVAPNTVLARESDESRRAEKAKQLQVIETGLLEKRTFRLKYANTEDLKQKLLGQKFSQKCDDVTKTCVYTYDYDEKQRILSERGSAISDHISNTLTVTDIPKKINDVADFLTEVDQPTRQVMIEARIVEVNTNQDKELGIQWGVNYKAANGLSSVGGLSGTPSVATGPFTGNNYLIDFPATGASALSGSGITFGILNPAKTIGLDLQLSALESFGTGKVITNPKVLTLDRQAAKILQGKSIPIRKLNQDGTISTEFKDVTMELNVTPMITREKTLELDIKIKKEELDPTIPSIEGVPGTDKKEAVTKVRMQDGETVVIGGLYKINTSDTETGVPWLMRIPVLKYLFRKEKKSTNTTELMIFITPRIVVLERVE